MDSNEIPDFGPNSVRALLDELRDRGKINQEQVEEWTLNRTGLPLHLQASGFDHQWGEMGRVSPGKDPPAGMTKYRVKVAGSA